MIRRLPLLIAFALVGPLAGVARAADEAAVLRVQAAQLAADGECDRALPILQRARALAPDDAAAAFLDGQCLFAEKRYADAVVALEAAERLDPSRADVALLLGMAYYHHGQLERADAALARAEQGMPDSAELALYRGLVFLEQARSDEAAVRLQRAGLLDASAVEPAASYYGGLAHAGAGRQEEAEASLRRVGQLAPDSDWSRRAEEALASTSQPDYPLRRWLILQAGMDYDSNVALRGDDVSLPDDISDDEDGRASWSIDVGTELLRNALWGAGAVVRYDGSAHFSVSEFDQQYVGAAVWLDRRVGERTFLRLQPEFGAGFLDYNDYLRFYGTTAELISDLSRWGGARLYTRYAYNDYRFEELGSGALRNRRDRDGHALRVGYDHTLSVAEGTELRGGPYYRHYAAQGSEYDHDAVGGWLGVRQALPYGLTVDARGSYDVSYYEHPSTFLMAGESRRDRKDRFGAVEMRVERGLTERVSATLRWIYQNSDSNTRVFDYDQHIAGAYVTMAFGD